MKTESKNNILMENTFIVFQYLNLFSAVLKLSVQVPYRIRQTLPHHCLLFIGSESTAHFLTTSAQREEGHGRLGVDQVSKECCSFVSLHPNLNSCIHYMFPSSKI
jgi:hypothetical protein